MLPSCQAKIQKKKNKNIQSFHTVSPQRFSHWAGIPLELLVNSRSSFRINGTLNVLWMAALISSFGAQQREIMISRKSGAFVQPKVRARAETHN